ncbi:MAG: tetratricopeptide repeat protein, partial [Terriglobia bacterium]
MSTTKTKTGGLLLGLFLLLWPIAASAQSTAWEKYMEAGAKAYQQGRYAEAEKPWQAALKEAEGFGPEDPRLATTLNTLAALYQAQGRYAEAEPLSKRAIAIDEQVLGPDHPDLAKALNTLAALYYAQGQYTEAEPLSKRAI